jgi:hypothetical protein
MRINKLVAGLAGLIKHRYHCWVTEDIERDISWAIINVG